MQNHGHGRRPGADVDPFDPPDVDWTPVSARLAALRRLLLLVALAALTLTGAALLLLVPVPARSALLVALLLLAALVAGWGWRAIGRNVASWGYAERADDLLVRRGVLLRELVAVPYGRMQFVDVHSGPLQRAFGVATVQLHTASAATDARIPGLPPAEAARLRDRLAALGEAQAAGL